MCVCGVRLCFRVRMSFEQTNCIWALRVFVELFQCAVRVCVVFACGHVAFCAHGRDPQAGWRKCLLLMITMN